MAKVSYNIAILMYKNIKIDRFELYEKVKKDIDSETEFKNIDDFKDSIKQYIFTDINLTDHTKPIEYAFQSRLQLLESETLLRGLMLKEGMVESLNNNNFPSYYAILKSFLEIPAVLGYITHLIYNKDKFEEIIPEINILHLGNREAGSFPTGSVKAKNVLTMFEKLDEVFKSLACADKTKEECMEIRKSENILTSTYADVCNYGHANFNANLSIGILTDDGWKARNSSKGYKEELWAFYMPGFSVGMNTIKIMCSLIGRNEKVQNFNLMGSQPYFKEERV